MQFIANHLSKSAALAAAAVFLVAVTALGYRAYFVTWATNPHVPGYFTPEYLTIGRQINALPASTPIYVIVEGGPGIPPVRGIPLSAETTMFLTDSFTTSGQEEHNVHYLLPDRIGEIPPDASIFDIQ